MSYIYLGLGLLLPWLNGCLWLRLFESFFAGRGNESRFRMAGYGFFFGYALLSALVILLSRLTGTVSYLPVMSSLAFLTVTAMLLLRHRASDQKEQQIGNRALFPFRKFGLAECALLILAIWILLHWSFSLLEILARPVYPWDAWLMWVYRAKAWFAAGAVIDFQNTADWLTAAAPAYTSNALHYPLFASIIPFWSAISLGYWSETLINLPVALSGIAIALALYGQCREGGVSAFLALATCYLLFSTPIFGTHLALAGYADIWMCGFAGLGFVALIQGSISKSLKQSLIGLAMIALGALVKNEGLVWLIGAAVFILVLHVPRKPLLMTLGIGTALALLAIAFGINMIMLPWLGEVSVTGNQVTLPVIGTFTLQVFNVWKQYLVSFFFTGSWSLTWLLLAGCLVIFASAARERTNYVVASFIFIFLATQVMIFVFSSHGEFAIRYTAINRLPLHFLPAILFSAAIIVQHRLNPARRPGANAATGLNHAA